MTRAGLVLAGVLVTMVCGPAAAQSFQVGALHGYQPTNKSEGCLVYSHKYQMLPPHLQKKMKRSEKLEWIGSCAGGLAQGKGTIKSYIDGKPGQVSLVELVGGKRQGKSVTRIPSARSRADDVMVYESFERGLQCGDGGQYDMRGRRMVAFRGDCRGGMRQTSNPMDYALQQLGGPSLQLRMLYKFMFNMDGRHAGNTKTCLAEFERRGFSRSVALSWCSMNW